MNKEKVRYPIYKYLLLYMILFEAGTPIQTVYPREFILCTFFIAVILFLSMRRMFYKSAVILMFAGAFMMLANLANIDIHFSTVVMILMLLFSACVFSYFYKKEEFEHIYVTLMVFLAMISIVFYAIGILFPDFVKILPVFHGSNGDYPIVMGVFFYPCGSNRYLSVLRRNNGLFREMGLFAVLLIWALCIMLQRKNESRYTLKKIIIIIVALITTFSTTGIFAFAMLLPVIIKWHPAKGIWKGTRALKYMIYMFSIVAFGGIVWHNRLLLFGKLNPANVSFGNFLLRFRGMMGGFSLFIKYPWGSGPTRYALEVIGGADSISYFLGCFGLGTTFIIFLGFFRFIQNLDYSKGNKLFVLGAATVVLLTQGVSEYVVFYMVVLYGYAGHKKSVLKMKEYEAKKDCNDQLLLQRV